MKGSLIIIINILLLFPILAHGEETGTPGSPLSPPELGSLATTFSIIKVLAAFMVVAGVMALVFKLMGKIGPRAISKAGLIEVLDTRMIAQKKYISVVRIADQDLAVAISDSGISLLCTLNSKGKTIKQEQSPFDSSLNDAGKKGGHHAEML